MATIMDPNHKQHVANGLGKYNNYQPGHKPVYGRGKGEMECTDSKGRVVDPVRMMLQKQENDAEAAKAKQDALKLAAALIDDRLTKKGLKSTSFDEVENYDHDAYRKKMERQRQKIMNGEFDSDDSEEESDSSGKKKKKKKDKKKKDKKKKDKKEKKKKDKKSKKRKRDSDSSDSDS